MEKYIWIFFLWSFQTFAIISDFRYLKARDSHLIFDDKLNTREVAITFAGRIDSDILSKIVTKLEAENLTAHFFLNGDSAMENLQIVNQLASRGHVIGSQGLSVAKVKSPVANEQEMLTEIQIGHEAVFASIGFVYPFIRLSPRQGSIAVREMIKESGAFAFYWNIDFYPENPAQSMRDNLKREDYRGIVSFPLFRESTLVALDTLIEEIKKEDLTVITVLPSEESSWREHPPIVRKAIREEIQKNGSIYRRKVVERRDEYEI
ncbi:MAG: polysaccharide deacetylase family protein [Bdellovibrionaceae bacterium]|nr:polysaccharide deacetylase family protein [Pseudobdellovibrionaceae bacterium]